MRGCALTWRRRTQRPRQLPEGERWQPDVGVDRARCRRRKLARGHHVGHVARPAFTVRRGKPVAQQCGRDSQFCQCGAQPRGFPRRVGAVVLMPNVTAQRETDLARHRDFVGDSDIPGHGVHHQAVMSDEAVGVSHPLVAARAMVDVDEDGLVLLRLGLHRAGMSQANHVLVELGLAVDAALPFAAVEPDRSLHRIQRPGIGYGG
jgi:hypothetical protein